MPFAPLPLLPAIQEAERLATSFGHPFISMEHLLRVGLRDAYTVAALKACKADPAAMALDLDQALALHPVHPELSALMAARDPQGGSASLTPSMFRVIGSAQQHAVSAGKHPSASTVLHAIYFMFQEEDTQAVAVLSRQGLTAEAIKHVLARGLATPTPTADAAVASEEPSDALSTYAVDLNARAKAGKCDPLIGRQVEVARLVQILCRRRKNNPLLVGDPGVGKTALAEGLAWKIVNGQVPAALADTVVYALDLGAMVSGTKFRGDFEERIKAVLNQVKAQPNALLFLDEIHTLIGAGGGKGAMDGSNLLKPALANGDLRVMGATTFQEFRGVFEKDAALARRFQKVDLNEPSRDESLAILEGLSAGLGAHHKVTYTPEALEAAVDLSVRHQPSRQLPDKAIDLLDEAGAYRAAHDRANATPVGVADVERAIAAVANVPVARSAAHDRAVLAHLDVALKAQVFGQDAAADAVADAVRMARAGMNTAGRPIGSFLFAGPTGVGKTEMARQLASSLGLALIRFDMSEYGESHSLARLIGAPPGYVGYDKGGLLTEAVAQTPHAVVLLDEIEKAHPDLFNLLLQVMDAGRLTDTTGRTVSFANVVLIMTTNAGASATARASMGFLKQDHRSDADGALKTLFSPEFRNRLDETVRFLPLGTEQIRRVVRKFIAELQVQVAERGVALDVTDEAMDWLAVHGFDAEMGARPLGRTITAHLKKPLARLMLFGELAAGGTVSVRVGPDGLLLEPVGRSVAVVADQEPVPA